MTVSELREVLILYADDLDALGNVLDEEATGMGTAEWLDLFKRNLALFKRFARTDLPAKMADRMRRLSERPDWVLKPIAKRF